MAEEWSCSEEIQTSLMNKAKDDKKPKPKIKTMAEIINLLKNNQEKSNG